jgi:hypothetical protein
MAARVDGRRRPEDQRLVRAITMLIAQKRRHFDGRRLAPTP